MSSDKPTQSFSDSRQFLLALVVLASGSVAHHGRAKSPFVSTPSETDSTMDTEPDTEPGQTRKVRSTGRPSRMVVILTLVLSLLGFMFGYDTGYISSALVSVGTDLGEVLTNGDKELITSATSLGALIGAVIGGVLANLIGRKKVLLGSNVVFVVGTIVQLAAHAVWPMIVGRFILGLGVGVALLISPLMLSELAPAQYRGRLIVTNCMFITGGQLVAYFINWGLTDVKHGWRVSVGLCMVPLVLQFVLFWFLPDTPRFYVMDHNLDRARQVIKKTHRDASPDFVEAILAEMVVANSKVLGNNAIRQVINLIKVLHKNPANFRALILACGLQGIQQFTGFNSLLYFSATVFETIGFSNPTAVLIIVAATNFVFTGVALCIIDRVGRRNILLFAIPVMAIAMALCAIAFHFLGIKFGANNEVIVSQAGISGWGILVIMSMVLFVASYAIGIGNSAWTGVELFSDVNVRSVGAMYAAATNWAGSLVIALTFLTMLEKITPTGTFSFFGGLCVISFVFVYFLLPEVLGLDLEETTQFLEKGFMVKEALALSKERRRERKHESDLLKNKASLSSQAL